jgi:hypothetical protein
MRRPVVVAMLVLGLVLVSAGSLVLAANPDSSKKNFDAELSGWQEVPSISTVGVGTLDVRLESPALMSYTLIYSGLEGGATLFSHIHLGQPAVNGGVSVFLCGGGDKPPCPPVAGTITGEIDPADVVGPAGQGIEAGSFDELVRALRAGHTYANIHTTRWPGGEIRGQISNESQRQIDQAKPDASTTP